MGEMLKLSPVLTLIHGGLTNFSNYLAASQTHNRKGNTQ